MSLLPFLNTALTFACFQSSGTQPSCRDCWKICVRYGADSLAVSFSTLVGMSSGPVALDASRARSCFITPLSVMHIFWMGGISLFFKVGSSESSMVNTLSYCLFRILAISFASVVVEPSPRWRVLMPEASLRLAETYFQNRFETFAFSDCPLLLSAWSSNPLTYILCCCLSFLCISERVWWKSSQFFGLLKRFAVL